MRLDWSSKDSDCCSTGFPSRLKTPWWLMRQTCWWSLYQVSYSGVPSLLSHIWHDLHFLVITSKSIHFSVTSIPRIMAVTSPFCESNPRFCYEPSIGHCTIHWRVWRWSSLFTNIITSSFGHTVRTGFWISPKKNFVCIHICIAFAMVVSCSLLQNTF